MGKAEELRDGLIENSERMRKIHATVGQDFGLHRDPPGCTREIAEAIDRDYRCLIEGADMESRGKVSQMMLDRVDRRTDGLSGECLLKKSWNPCPRKSITQSSEHQIDVRSLRNKVGYFPQ